MYTLFQILFKEFDREKGKHPLKRIVRNAQIVIITLYLNSFQTGRFDGGDGESYGPGRWQKRRGRVFHLVYD